MDNSSPDGVSLVAVCAVSGSVALLAFRAYKRLLSDFMTRMELELGPGKFGSNRIENADMIEPSRDDSVEYRRAKRAKNDRGAGEMPVNRQVLYRGILQYRNFRGRHISSDSF